MKFPLSLHVSHDGSVGDVLDADGLYVATFTSADDARELLALAEKGRATYRQTDAYEPPDGGPTIVLGPGHHDLGCMCPKCGQPPIVIRSRSPFTGSVDLKPVDRRLAELARESDLSRHFNLPNPADAVHDSPTD